MQEFFNRLLPVYLRDDMFMPFFFNSSFIWRHFQYFVSDPVFVESTQRNWKSQILCIVFEVVAKRVSSCATYRDVNVVYTSQLAVGNAVC
jgi:hypothetical protein